MDNYILSVLCNCSAFCYFLEKLCIFYWFLEVVSHRSFARSVMAGRHEWLWWMWIKNGENVNCILVVVGAIYIVVRVPWGVGVGWGRGGEGEKKRDQDTISLKHLQGVIAPELVHLLLKNVLLKPWWNDQSTISTNFRSFIFCIK